MSALGVLLPDVWVGVDDTFDLEDQKCNIYFSLLLTAMRLLYMVMSVSTFIQRQITQIRQGGSFVVFRKIKQASQLLANLPFYIVAVPVVGVIRLIKPWLLVRIGGLISSRIGHFAANTELYLCERDASIHRPLQRHVDLFYMAYKPICNRQLATMWKRILRIWPAWFLAPVAWVNQLFPGGAVHEIGTNIQHDRDVNNLLDRISPHLQFTIKEEARGEAGLRNMGIPYGSPFVCLAVRDSAYLETHLKGNDFSYHNYRDTDIQNYVLAIDELADYGYYVIRMGVQVHQAINSNNIRVIDYATNGMRNDFMDIYLGAKCEFCISVGTGFDAIPYIFHRPIVYVNMVPLGYLFTFLKKSIGITKHHYKVKENREISVTEIFSLGIGFSVLSSDYESKGIQLIENTPEEIRDVVIEMAKRLNGSWQPHEDDEVLQNRFWKIFPINAVDSKGIRLHGEIWTRFGAQFLRNNPEWLC